MDCLQLARQLHDRNPENYLFHLNQAQILERMGERAQAAEAYAEVARRAAGDIPNYQKLPLEKIRYSLGERMLELGSDENALHQFRSAAADPNTPERDRVLAHLRAGEILDEMGQREEAVSYFRKVRTLPEFDGSHKKARKRLRSP